MIGLEQTLKDPLSSRQYVVAVGSSDEKVNVAVVVLTIPPGPPVIVMVGAIVSTDQLRVLLRPTLPLGSTARTVSVWLPWARLL